MKRFEFRSLLPPFVFYGLFFLILSPLLFRKIYANDLWKALYTARYVVSNLRFPHHGEFTFSPVVNEIPVHLYTWLGDLTLYGTYQLMGAPGLQLLRLLFLAIAVLLIHSLVSYKRCPYVLSLLLLFSFGISQKLLLRNALFAVPMMTVIIWCLLRSRELNNFRLLYLLVPVVTIWSNMHGSYLAGITFIGLFWVGSAVDDWWYNKQLSTFTRHFSLVAVLSCLAVTFFKPRPDWTLWKAPGFLIKIFNNISSGSIVVGDMLRETGPGHWPEIGGLQNPLSRPQAIFVWTTVIVVVLALIHILWSQKQFSWFIAIPAFFVVIFGFSALRFVGFIPLILIPLILHHGITGRFTAWHWRRWGSVLLIGVFTGGIVYSIFIGDMEDVTFIREHRFGIGFVSTFESEVPNYLFRHYRTEPCFNHYDIGGFLIWRWGAEKKVFIDSRNWAYRPSFLRNFYRDDPGTLAGKYGLTCAIIPRTSRWNYYYFIPDPGWHIVAYDQGVIAYQRVIEGETAENRRNLLNNSPVDLSGSDPDLKPLRVFFENHSNDSGSVGRYLRPPP